MKKVIILTLIFYCGLLSFAQENSCQAKIDVPEKYALVIGNAAYTGLSPLTNPVNDANDISAVLTHLGFNVDKVLNGSLEQMESAVERLKKKLAPSNNAYGFFFYAGHGVQAGGENYLIPVDANIPNENYLRNRAVSVQQILDDLKDSRNSLNVVVLDACRDNPFGWSRSSTRGLAIVSRQPSDSIIIYSTSAGQRASDGDGRNGLFTSQLLNNLATPGLEVKEVFNRTGADVAKVSNNQQIPAIYSQFFGTAFLGEKPVDSGVMIQQPSTTVIISGQEKEKDPAKFWSVGASAGSSFVAPWFVFTAHGTIAPVKYMFLELGVDLGLISGARDAGYYSLYPFANVAFFWPLNAKIGVYTGVGGGLLIVSYKFEEEGDYSKNYPAVNFIAGINLFTMVDISYTIKTNFSGLIHKASVGYTYRF